MYNANKVIPGIIIFILFFTFPIWFSFGRVEAVPKPELPKGNVQCVASKAYMRAYHMKLLLRWRNLAIRHGQRFYKAANGKTYLISLQNTCLKCHKTNERFCERCHKFVAVHPDCWHCHLTPEEVAKWQ